MSARVFSVLLIPALAASAADPAAKSEPAGKDGLAAVIGTWKIVEFQDDAKDRMARLGVAPAEEGGAKDGGTARIAKLVIAADDVFVIRGDGKRDVVTGLTGCAWRGVKFDPSASPMHIDLTENVEGNPKVKSPKTFRGILAVEGGRLKLCWNEEGGEQRPGKFESDAANNLFVCERLSDKPEPSPKP
jgi:uncharacterized protein (TIGR03067 family)